MYFLHAVGAVGTGFYVLLPFLVGRMTKLAGEGQAGLADGLVLANRFAQYFLILQLLTGGYMMTFADYSVLWMALTTVLFLAIAALGGIIAKPLKAIAASIRAGQSATSSINKARTLSFIILVLYIAIIILMQYPDHRG